MSERRKVKEMTAAVETAVKERPILMSGPMIKAILEGRKSMTRRVVKPMPFIDFPTGFRLQEQYKLDHHPKCSFVQAGMLCDCEAIYEPWKKERIAACPYGKVGERLWVRETWAIADIYDKDSGNEGQMPFELNRGTRGISIWYRAGGQKAYKSATRGRWRPSIFMPKAASRITLEITGVRVERVDQISAWDIECEGTPENPMNQPIYRNDHFQRRKDFKYLWNSINDKRGFGWDSNPFVWVVSFKKVK